MADFVSEQRRGKPKAFKDEIHFLKSDVKQKKWIYLFLKHGFHLFVNEFRPPKHCVLKQKPFNAKYKNIPSMLSLGEFTCGAFVMTFWVF